MCEQDVCLLPAHGHVACIAFPASCTRVGVEVLAKPTSCTHVCGLCSMLLRPSAAFVHPCVTQVLANEMTRAAACRPACMLYQTLLGYTLAACVSREQTRIRKAWARMLDHDAVSKHPCAADDGRPISKSGLADQRVRNQAVQCTGCWWEASCCAVCAMCSAAHAVVGAQATADAQHDGASRCTC
eukprot:583845-Pelagomonas_calceolata.AAC.3